MTGDLFLTQGVLECTIGLEHEEINVNFVCQQFDES